MPFPLALAIGGASSLLGLLGRPKRRNYTADQFNPDPNNLAGQRYDQLLDPNYMRSDFINAARQFTPGQSDFFNRLRGSGLGTGVSSALADEQYRASQSRALGQATQAYGGFRMNQQNQANSVLDMILGNNARSQQMALQANMNNQDRRDSFNNALLGAGTGLMGTYLGQRGMFGSPGNTSSEYGY